MKKNTKIFIVISIILSIFLAQRGSFASDEEAITGRRSIPEGLSKEELLQGNFLKDESEAKYIVQFKSGRFIFEKGSHLTSFRGRQHVLIQFYEHPTKAQKRELEKLGVELIDYIPEYTWFATVSSRAVNKVVKLDSIHAIGNILAQDRVRPEIWNGEFSSFADNQDDTVNLFIEIFKDADIKTIKRKIKKLGASDIQPGQFPYTLNITIAKDKLKLLAEIDEILWIEGKQAPAVPTNDVTRNAIQAEILQGSSYGLDGSGVDVCIFEAMGSGPNGNGPVVDNHQDFSGRLTVGRGAGSIVSSHATHVAGIVGGDGSLSISKEGTDRQWRGMAPGVDMYSYYAETGFSDSYGEAIGTYGIGVSTNSWGYTVSQVDGTCGNYGNYYSEHDKIIADQYSWSDPITIVVANGNERDDGDCGMSSNSPYINYGCVSQPATGKNIISVGAIDAHTEPMSMSSFSSWGPTDDGRIKPDICAPGLSIKSTWTGNNYGVDSGTSMATPAVAGITALFYEDFRSRHSGVNPWPSTVKAMLIHTAGDLGNEGPDYQFGYGSVRAKDAIDQMRSNSWVEGDVGNGQTDTYNIDVPTGTSSVKVTLVWDDFPGQSNSALALVNDLDLRVFDANGTRKYPWTLNPASPADPGVRSSEDHINNVEQVYVNSSISYGSWRLEVKGQSVPQGQQRYTIVFSPVAAIPPPPAMLTYPSGTASNPYPYFDWEYDGSHILEYVCRVSTNSNPDLSQYYVHNNYISVTGSDSSQDTVTTKLPNGVYYWFVYQRNSLGFGPPASGSFTLNATAAPGSPMMVTYPTGTIIDDTPFFDWQDMPTTEIIEYAMRIDTESNPEATPGYVYNRYITNQGSNSSQDSVAALSDGFYYWFVYQRNVAGVWSAPATGTFTVDKGSSPDPYIPEPPNNMRTQDVGTSYINWLWNDNSNPLSFSGVNSIASQDKEISLEDTVTRIVINAPKPVPIGKNVSISPQSALNGDLPPPSIYLGTGYEQHWEGGNWWWVITGETNNFYSPEDPKCLVDYGPVYGPHDGWDLTWKWYKVDGSLQGEVTLHFDAVQSGYWYPRANAVSNAGTGIYFGGSGYSEVMAYTNGAYHGGHSLYVYSPGEDGFNFYNHSGRQGLPMNTTSYQDSGLSANTEYWAYVNAYNVLGTSDNSNIYYIYTLANSPSALSFGTITSSSIEARWSSNGNPTGTQYFCRNITNGQSSGWITSTSWTSTGLSSGTAYSFDVKARNGNQVETGTINFGSATTLEIAPNAPSNIRVTDKTTSSLTWGWDDTSTNENGFYLYSTAGNQTLGSNVTSYMSTNLSANTYYSAYVKAFNSVGTSSSSNSAGAYTLSNTLVVSSFGNITTNSITAKWGSNSNPSGTQYYCENTTVGTSSNWITDVSWVSTDLSSGTTYNFRVKARNGDGVETGWIELGSAVTTAELIFSDDPIISGETRMNAQHIVELADAVDAIRASRGQGGYNWNWSTAPQQDGPILVEYIQKIREAVENLKGSDIQWPTDDTLIQNVTPIKAAHINELRRAIEAIW